MLTDVELNEMNDKIQEYCTGLTGDSGCDEDNCGIYIYCANCLGVFGPEHPDDTIDAYSWLQEHGYVDNHGDDEQLEHDVVNHPNHYCQGGIECIEAIKAAVVGKTGIEAVCVANVIKYLWRYEEKNGLEDVKKAAWYLARLITELEANQLPL